MNRPLFVPPLAGALAVGAALLVYGCKSSPSRVAYGGGKTGIERLSVSRQSPHAYGRAGDLVLHDGSGATLTFAATMDRPGHRPLRGALLDAALGDADRTDPLLWWRAGWVDAQLRLHVGPADDVEGVECKDHASGIRVAGTVDGVALESTVCPATSHTFSVTTSARGLPAGATLGDELNPGPATVLIDDGVADWEGERSSEFVALVDAGAAVVMEVPGMRLQRRLVHIAAESFPAAVMLRFEGTSVTRTLHVIDGDAFDALASTSLATRVITAGVEGRPRTEIGLLDGAGRVVAHGVGATPRVLHLPPRFASGIEVRDEEGILASRATLANVGDRFIVPPAPRGELSLRYVDDRSGPLPVHVLFRSLDAAEEPSPRVRDGGFGTGRSLYLVAGAGRVALVPGRYRITASHGITYALDTRDVTVAAGGRVSVDAVLKQVVDTSGWTSGDFHLHAAPSPDAPVSLDERVTSLACEGVELAVATDHNRVTDYAPSVARLGLGTRIVTITGDEMTSAGRTLWGHFNVYPLPLSPGAPEDIVPGYFEISPDEMFAGARDAGARLLQVNHPRMDPQIGYFDLTHLDPRTGHADTSFSPRFDVVEAFNGIWLESPDKVRQGAVDLVGLARRGMRVTTTGNSDSHRLLYEEAGYPRTFVHVPAAPIAGRTERVLDGLVRGDTTVSSGPFVEVTVEGHGPGSVVALPPSHRLRVHVRVSAPAWVPVEHVEIWHDDTVAQRFDVSLPATDGVRFERDVELPFDRDGVVLAWADADAPLPDVLPYAHARPIGFTGMVYVDGDGDGRVVVPPAESRP
jgi:hypothetical protein